MYYNFDKLYSSGKRYLILRHDVDFSVDRALELAKIENNYGISSTYFFLLHSDFYNIFEKDSFNKDNPNHKNSIILLFILMVFFMEFLDEINIRKNVNF